MSAGLILLIFALVVFFVTRMFKRRKVATRVTSVCSEEGGNRERSRSVTAQQLASKVIQDPSFDMLYLNTLVTALEQETCLRGTCDSPNALINESIGGATHGRNKSEHEITQSGLNETCSLAEDVISVHEYAESCRNESDDQSSLNGDKIVGTDSESSEDESFHSLSDLCTSSNLRPSNVSVGSFTDPVEFYSPNQSNRSLSESNTLLFESALNQMQQPNTIIDVPHGLQTLNDSPKQPPTTISPLPPPPPLPSFAHFSPVRFCSSSKPLAHASESVKILHSSLFQFISRIKGKPGKKPK